VAADNVTELDLPSASPYRLIGSGLMLQYDSALVYSTVRRSTNIFRQGTSPPDPKPWQHWVSLRVVLVDSSGGGVAATIASRTTTQTHCRAQQSTVEI